MPQYKVRPGFRHGVGKKYGPGDTVTMTEQEAVDFLDKLELVVEKDVSVPEFDADKVSDPKLRFWQENTSEPAIEPGSLPVFPSATLPNAGFAGERGISEKMEDALHEAGYFTWEDVLSAGVTKINEAGIDMIHARMLVNIAQKQVE